MSLVTVLQPLRLALPDGRALPEVDWRTRHRVMTRILALHVPAILAYALAAGMSLGHSLVEASLPLVLVAVAVRSGDRRTRSMAVALGLITCSAVFVHLSEGLIEWHFHYFVTLALIALYQEWRVYLVALAFVVVQHGLGSWLSPEQVYNHGNGEFRWALIHGAFVLAASACHITAWRLNEVATARAETFRRELHVGQQSVMAQLETTAQMRRDLIATASHEFRTPLTAIGGAASTLRRHDHALASAERAALLDAILARTDRLGQMLESMLIAAEVEPPTGQAAPLSSVVVDVLPPSRRDGTVVVRVPDDAWVGIGRRPLAQLLERLVDSARLQGDEGAAVRLSATTAGPLVIVEARIEATDIDAHAITGLLEPFRGGNDAAPRSVEIGLGLYAVRRIAEVHGGKAEVMADDGDLVIRVALPRAPADLPAPRSAPAATRAGADVG